MLAEAGDKKPHPPAPGIYHVADQAGLRHSGREGARARHGDMTEIADEMSQSAIFARVQKTKIPSL